MFSEIIRVLLGIFILAQSIYRVPNKYLFAVYWVLPATHQPISAAEPIPPCMLGSWARSPNITIY